eukprot:gb/GECG01001294.1/.p1 GENE.gb/GECG01001294.1/~~gb/GECG01001294.1/.p1  ORF type:complete len:111 (+),score=5.62 gb/GECG01001294.1/:1-333(+)
MGYQLDSARRSSTRLDQCISRIKTRKCRDNRVDSQRQTHEANDAIAPHASAASDTKQLRSALDEQVNYNQTIRSRIQRNALYLQHLPFLNDHGQISLLLVPQQLIRVRRV